MKLSLRWLRDYAALDATLDLLVRTLVETGTEVGATEDFAAGIVVARVLALEPMPGSTHGLQIADVDVGPSPPPVLAAMGIATDPLRVVTGAPNVRAGDLVPYAPPGTRPPALDEPLGVRTYRGKHRSPGMLLSPAELGLGDDAGGLMVLERGTPGQPLRDVVDLDVVIDAEVTTNRPDCLCHLGIARELAAALGEPLNEPDRSIPESHASSVATAQRTTVAVEDAGACPRFAVRVVENVRIGRSPEWMQRRLRAVGLRPINGVVDVTNFVARELGQPLHAFDLDKLVAATAATDGRAGVVVRRARAGERLVTLDGVDRELASGDIAVCAGSRVVSLAGVMGGLDTAVDDNTRAVLIEAATWDGIAVRATATRLGLRTDASTLFEKGLSDTLPPLALDRAARLMVEASGGHVLDGAVDVWAGPLPEIAPIALSAGQIEATLGMAVDATDAATILAHLGFAVEQSGAALVVAPPHFRRDVHVREDVIEEVGRMLGYARVPSTLPGRRVPLGPPLPPAPVEDAVREASYGAGFDEAITYSFTAGDVAAVLPGLGAGREPIPLRNPLTSDWQVLRTGQLPGLAQSLALNLSRGVEEAALFELGRAFWEGERRGLPEGSTADGADSRLTPLPAEPLLLSVIVHREGGAGEAAHTLRHIQALFQSLVRELAGVRLDWGPAELAGMIPGRTGEGAAGGRRVAVAGELDAAAMRRFDLRGRIVAGELDIEALTAGFQRPVRYAPPPRLPAVVHDLAVTVRSDERAGAALDVIRMAGGDLLEQAELYDEYRGEAVGAGRKGWTFRLTFRAPDRTLTGDEAVAAQAAIARALQERCGAEVRA